MQKNIAQILVHKRRSMTGTIAQIRVHKRRSMTGTNEPAISSRSNWTMDVVSIRENHVGVTNYGCTMNG